MKSIQVQNPSTRFEDGGQVLRFHLYADPPHRYLPPRQRRGQWWGGIRSYAYPIWEDWWVSTGWSNFFCSPFSTVNGADMIRTYSIRSRLNLPSKSLFLRFLRLPWERFLYILRKFFESWVNRVSSNHICPLNAGPNSGVKWSIQPSLWPILTPISRSYLAPY